MPGERDKRSGKGRRIDRRDFLQGTAIGAVALVAGALAPELAAAAEAERQAQDAPDYYPPARLGLRGSHPGSFEAAHSLSDGAFWDQPGALVDTGEEYDLVIVGGGISGLAAAHFWRAADPRARVLIIENHDDFGGHAKRNEFQVAGRMLLINGGTELIDSPFPYSPIADGLLRELGVDPDELSKTCDDPAIYDSRNLKASVFFDKETFGADRLVLAAAQKRAPWTEAELNAFLAQAPLSDPVRRDIFRIELGEEDYLPGLSSDAKKDRLSRISYQDYLLQLVKADRGVIPFYLHRTDDLWACGIDAVSALDCWGARLPGFRGLKLEPGATNRMGYTPAGFVSTDGSYTFHYPDGNASIARLLVGRLIPAAMPGGSGRAIVTSRADYSQLDRPGAPVRIRLNHLVLRARNTRNGRGVELAYTPSTGGGKVYRVRGKACVLACWNMMIPYLCSEMPHAQKDALRKLVKSPLVYANVGLRDWTAFEKLGIRHAYCPGSYFSSFRLNEPVNIGSYRSSDAPDQPMLVHMLRTPAKRGLPEREQHKAGRLELLSTPFDTFEAHIRDQLGRALGPGGFDPARDIMGIAVNRWPHGYAPEYNALVDGDTTNDRTPNLVGRSRFGRIAIANSDSGMAAYTDVAIDQAHRAVHELLSS